MVLNSLVALWTWDYVGHDQPGIRYIFRNPYHFEDEDKTFENLFILRLIVKVIVEAVVSNKTGLRRKK